jgi:TonB family protein
MNTKISFFIIFFVACSFNLSAQNKVQSAITNSCCLKHDTVAQNVVDVNAKFQGGDLSKFQGYISREIRFPVEAIKNKWGGKIHIKFIVNWDGKVKDVSVYSSSKRKLLDEEAIRVVKTSPDWTPAQLDSVYVPQIFIIPITFKSLGITDYEVINPIIIR